MKNEYDEYRVITLVAADQCYYVDYNDIVNKGGFFYNPTNACVSVKATNSRFKKVGEFPEEVWTEFKNDMTKVLGEFNKAFIKSDEILNSGKYDVEKYCSASSTGKNT